jgi:hypothetical protein
MRRTSSASAACGLATATMATAERIPAIAAIRETAQGAANARGEQDVTADLQK